MIPTNRGPMTTEQIVDELLFSSYSSNRDRGMTVEGLTRVLGLLPHTAVAMERRYQEAQAQ
jgi:hypothetical protein